DNVAVLVGNALDTAAHRELAHDDAARGPHDGGIDVLIAVGHAPNRRDVHAPLVRERAAADVGRVLVRGEVGDLGDEVAQLVELGELPGRETPSIELQLDVRDDAAEVGVAAALSVAVDRPLDVSRARAARRERVGDAAAAVAGDVDPAARAR